LRASIDVARTSLLQKTPCFAHSKKYARRIGDARAPVCARPHERCPRGQRRRSNDRKKVFAMTHRNTRFTPNCANFDRSSETNPAARGGRMQVPQHVRRSRSRSRQ
jgi:hypothetical protein